MEHVILVDGHGYYTGRRVGEGARVFVGTPDDPRVRRYPDCVASTVDVEVLRSEGFSVASVPTPGAML